MLQQTNNIISIHPSYGVPEERCFWSEMVFHIGTRGWNYIPINFANLAPRAGHDIYIQLPREKGPMPERCKTIAGGQLPAWVAESDIAMLSEWMRLAYKPGNPLQLHHNLAAYAMWTEFAVLSLRPSLVILTSLLPLTMLFWLAARHHGVKTLFYERSPCGGMWMEPDGNFSDSSIWTRFKEVEAGGLLENYRPAGIKAAKALLDNPGGFRKGEDCGHSWPQLPRGRPVFLLLMDNVLFSGWSPRGWPRQKETYPLYEAPEEAVSQVAGIVRRMGGILVLKRHPICRVYGKEKPHSLPADVVYYDGPVQDALKASDVVICFISKTVFPALAMGKPVVTLAQNPAAASGSTYHPSSPDGVEQALRDAAGKVDLERKRERFLPFAGWLSRDYYFSYASRPPVYPALAAECGPCDAVHGPAQLLDASLPPSGKVKTVPRQALCAQVQRLKYLAGTSSGETERPVWTQTAKTLQRIGQGARHVALYGAGTFARQLFMEADAEEMLVQGGASFRVFDDKPDREASTLFAVYDSRDLPDFVAGPGDVVVLATDIWQKPMRARLRELGVQADKIVDLFKEPIQVPGETK